MRIIYLALAVWGAVHPMYYFVSWFQTDGLNLGLMVAAWHANAASSGLVWFAAVSLPSKPTQKLTYVRIMRQKCCLNFVA
jgi:hypothetical protein